MTFDVRVVRPTRKPSANTVAASGTHAGHVVVPRVARPVRPTCKPRRIRYASGGYASGALAKMLPRLKNHSETENDSSASRSRFRSDSGRRQSARPSRKSAQKPSQTRYVLIL